MKILKKILLILFLILTILYPQEKNKHGKYPGDQPIPIIKDFPPAIQRLDSIKAMHHKQIKEYREGSGPYPYKCSDDFVKAYASALISSYLYYYDFHPNGIFWEYFSIAAATGLDITYQFNELPNPWKFLMSSKGVVLAEVIESRPTTLVGKLSIPLKHPFVIKARILDDILDAYKSDTIFIRHDNALVDETGDSMKTKLLFSFKSRSSMEIGDTIKQIYRINRDDDFLFVDKDSIIHDPSNVLGIEGKRYIDFKNELLNFTKKHGIRK